MIYPSKKKRREKERRQEKIFERSEVVLYLVGINSPPPPSFLAPTSCVFWSSSSPHPIPKFCSQNIEDPLFFWGGGGTTTTPSGSLCRGGKENCASPPSFLIFSFLHAHDAYYKAVFHSPRDAAADSDEGMVGCRNGERRRRQKERDALRFI